MEFSVESFVKNPTWEVLNFCRKADLIQIAREFEIVVAAGSKKAVIKEAVVAGLLEKQMLDSDTENKDVQEDELGDGSESPVGVKQLELQIKLEHLKSEHEIRLKELEFKNEQMKQERAIRLKELELEELRIKSTSHSGSKGFDLARHSRLVPPFNEKEVDDYFILFERLADTMEWPEEFKPLLLQSVLVGKAQSVYASLSVAQCSDYRAVKEAILRAYELVPEAYRQQFRKLKKSETQTHVEFAREQHGLFERWCKSQMVKNLDDLKNLILLEQFKRCVHERVATYLNEHSDLTLEKAAVLADEFTITHKAMLVKSQNAQNSNTKPFSKFVQTAISKSNQIKCNYCHVKGHIARDCPVIQRKNEKAKTVALIERPLVTEPLVDSCGSLHKVPDDFKPFASKGSVCLPGDRANKQPITILRDTAASQSILLKGILPITAEMKSGNSALMRGVEMKWFTEPLFVVHLESDLVNGPVEVVIRDLPIEGVSFLLGNDLAGEKVVGCPPTPVLSEEPKVCEEDFANLHPHVFSSCVLTRAMAKRKEKGISVGDVIDPSVVDLSETFLCESGDEMHESGSLHVDRDVKDQKSGDAGPEVPELAIPMTHDGMSVGKNSTDFCRMSRTHLISEQRKDLSLSKFYDEVHSEECDSIPVGYFLRNGVLMRKWQPYVHVEGAKLPVTQIVVPEQLRIEILKLAHAGGMAGHLGIKKTYDRILQNFFWPRLKTDIKRFCKTCQVCQFTGKPNQVVPVAHLQPIPAFEEPFSRVLVDCVGPLPKTKNGNQFMLTIMCLSTRFPEAIPLRKITAKSVVKALVKFFTTFGIPKVVQSDQGSNFMSKVFQQVLQQMGITHCPSSAYHPESQGALERFHSTLKSMLRAYCREFEKDWDEGVPLVLFAAREVVQESLGFSPNELVFGHRIRGPMDLLKEKLLEESDSSGNLLDHVSVFRYRLHRACEIAGANLKRSQNKMKVWYDRKARARSFDVGDQVLILLPVVGSPFEARFSGPYTVKEKVGSVDYLISTPDRRKKQRLCHINMMKPYYSDALQESGRSKSISCFAVSAKSSHEDFEAKVVGHLGNSEIFENLESYLSHLAPVKRSDMMSVLNSFKSIFSDVPTETNVLEHDIDVGDTKPIKQHAYRVNPEKRALLRTEVDYMIKHGIAEPSCSPWSSPCILVPKANTTAKRFCSDFRKLNRVTKPDSYPIPRMDDCVDRVGSAQYVSKFDLLKGYWQVPLTQRAKEYAAFVIPDGLFAYRRMPFGLRNAGATFQRLMNIVLRGLDNVEAYIDDVVVFSESWSDHLKHVRGLFERLKEANLTVNLSKSEIAQATVTYLGKIVGQGKVRPVSAKVDAILEFPVPTTRRELKRFLGMAGYYRAFCRNFSQIATRLTDLTSPKVAFQWTSECQIAFEQRKALLATAPVLLAPDFKRPFILYTDASDVGVGAVLVQTNDNGVEQPVAFFSKKLNPGQMHYSTIEKETLALVLAVKHFEVYVTTSDPLVVYTDHNPLLFLQKSAFGNRRLLRWSLALQDLPLLIKHVKGKDNVVADCLSRAS